MIERKFVLQKIKELEVQEFIAKSLKNVGHSHTKMVKTPLGEKIIIYASRPGLIVGRGGQNIKQLTKNLKKKFNFENPQIEINEVGDINLDANVVAERIIDSLERFGAEKFKAIGHKVMGNVMDAGALGIEIIISGKIPGSRAKSWRFYSGYLKKCGDIALIGVDKSIGQALLKKGVIGVKVSIMPPETELPDKIELLDDKEEVIGEVKEEGKEEVTEETKEEGKENTKEKKDVDEPVEEKKEKKPKKEEKLAEKPKEEKKQDDGKKE